MRIRTLARPNLDGIVVRPEGWDATSDEAHEILMAMSTDDMAWRGMTSEEYKNTVGAGLGVQSRGSYSLKGEGTQFSSDAGDAESYVNFGRDDPRKTGKSTYLVGVSREGLKHKRDGYLETEVSGKVPMSNVIEVYEFYADEGVVKARKLL